MLFKNKSAMGNFWTSVLPHFLMPWNRKGSRSRRYRLKEMTDDGICWSLSTSSCCHQRDKAVPRTPKFPRCNTQITQELVCPAIEMRVFFHGTIYTDETINPTISLSYVILVGETQHFQCCVHLLMLSIYNHVWNPWVSSDRPHYFAFWTTELCILV